MLILYKNHKNTQHTHCATTVNLKERKSCSSQHLCVGVTECGGFGAKAASRKRKLRWRGMVKTGMPRGPTRGNL